MGMSVDIYGFSVSAVDVTATPGAAALLESIPTKLFLANPELPDAVGALFRLSESELAQVRGLIPKRELYLRRPDGGGGAPARGRSGELLALHLVRIGRRGEGLGPSSVTGSPGPSRCSRAETIPPPPPTRGADTPCDPQRHPSFY